MPAVVPQRPQIVNAFTGELIDRDDLPAMKAALAEVDEFLEEKLWRRFHRVRAARDELAARIGELEPINLQPRNSRAAGNPQDKIERCPRCRTRLPKTVLREGE